MKQPAEVDLNRSACCMSEFDWTAMYWPEVLVDKRQVCSARHGILVVTRGGRQHGADWG